MEGKDGAPSLFNGAPPVGCSWPLHSLGARSRGERSAPPIGMVWIRHWTDKRGRVCFTLEFQLVERVVSSRTSGI